jgi:DNA-binding CsgD family transcriptional regulator
MTAYLMSTPVQSRGKIWRSDIASNQNLPPASSTPQSILGNTSSPSRSSGSKDLEGVWSALIDSLPQGLLMLTPKLQLVYANRRAKELCQQLAPTDPELTVLPTVILGACRSFLRQRVNPEPLVVETPSQVQELVRLWVRWLHTGPDQHDYLMVYLENCEETLREELWVEQKKYDLTEREAEIWILLRQEYTYSEISEMLQISANTVKTHVKHIYSKRRSRIHQKTFWASR